MSKFLNLKCYSSKKMNEEVKSVYAKICNMCSGPKVKKFQTGYIILTDELRNNGRR